MEDGSSQLAFLKPCWACLARRVPEGRQQPLWEAEPPAGRFFTLGGGAGSKADELEAEKGKDTMETTTSSAFVPTSTTVIVRVMAVASLPSPKSLANSPGQL